MGYRSDVRIITSKKGYDELKKYVDEHLSENMKEYNLLESTDVSKIGKDVSYIGWDSIKWYDGDFEEIDVIIAGLSHLEDNDYSYRFARIGESYDDYEEHYNDSEKEPDIPYNDYVREFGDNYIMGEIIMEEERDLG